MSLILYMINLGYLLDIQDIQVSSWSEYLELEGNLGFKIYILGLISIEVIFKLKRMDAIT